MKPAPAAPGREPGREPGRGPRPGRAERPSVAPTANDAAAKDPAAPQRLAHTDWLYHHLDIEGPAATLTAFSGAAAGSGTIPWALDLEQLEEDAFNTLAGAGVLSLHGARVLAGQLREAADRRHRLAVSQVGRSRACPFDLHALLPVPDDMLSLGPTHPQALAWLWAAWGTTEALRHATHAPAFPPPSGGPGSHPGDRSGGDPDAHIRLRILFWSADWTPWRALLRVQADWPELRFTTRPIYQPG